MSACCPLELLLIKAQRPSSTSSCPGFIGLSYSGSEPANRPQPVIVMLIALIVEEAGLMETTHLATSANMFRQQAPPVLLLNMAVDVWKGKARQRERFGSSGFDGILHSVFNDALHSVQ